MRLFPNLRTLLSILEEWRGTFKPCLLDILFFSPETLFNVSFFVILVSNEEIMNVRERELQ
jgi:hypothetical protein